MAHPRCHRYKATVKNLFTGRSGIEVASFVSPKRVPQMADAEAVLAALPHRDEYSETAGFLISTRRGKALYQGPRGPPFPACMCASAPAPE